MNKLPLLMVLLIIPAVSAEIFTLAPSYQSVTYPDSNNITISFKNPDFLWKDQTYVETTVTLTIEGNGEFTDGTQEWSKSYGDIDEAMSDSITVRVKQEASCKEGDTITINGEVSYKLDDGDTISKEPIDEEQTATFTGRYCETAVCEVKLAQCSSDKESVKNSLDVKDIELIAAQTQLEEYKQLYAQCNATQVVCEECSGIPLKSLLIPGIAVLLIILGMYIYIRVLKKS